MKLRNFIRNPSIRIKDGKVSIKVSTCIGKINFQYHGNNIKKDEKEIIIMAKEPSILISITEDAEIIDKICKNTASILKNENHITINRPQAVATIAYQFLKSAVQEIVKNRVEGEDININLFHLIDMGLTYKENADGDVEGNFTPYVQPGQEFKLAVKDNNVTETED